MNSVDIWFVNLGIRFSNWSKSFSLFGYEVYFYGVVIALSVLAGFGVAAAVAKKCGQDTEQYFDLAIFGVIFGIIGARIYYVVFAWDAYKNDLLQIFNLRGGGLAIYGGVIGAILTLIIYCRKKKMSIPLTLDVAFCGMITGQCTGRWSNFFNMEAFGRFTDGPLAMALNVAKVNPGMVTAELQEKSFVVDGIRYIQVHPTFLYESLWSLMTLLLMLFMTKRKKFNGEIFLLYLVGYGSGRFWIEGLRTDQLQIGHTGLAVSQILSAVLVLAASAVLICKLLQLRGCECAPGTVSFRHPEKPETVTENGTVRKGKAAEKPVKKDENEVKKEPGTAPEQKENGKTEKAAPAEKKAAETEEKTEE